MSDIHHAAARASLGFAMAFLILLTIVHVLVPELTVGHLISEYELSRYGWLMSAAFVTLGISSVTMFVAIRHAISTRAEGLGARWLLVIGLAYTGAAVFIPDSAAGFVNPPPATPSVTGYLHGVCGIVVIATSPIAFTLLGRSLARHPRWHVVSRRVRGMTHVPWFGLVGFVASLIGFGLAQPQTPAWVIATVLVSVSNRVLIVTYAAWLLVMAMTALRLRETASSKN